jgi:hypothetical protein
MSSDLAICPPPATFYYQNQLSSSLSRCSKRWLSSLWFSGVSKPIRSSSFLEDAGCSPRHVTNTASRHNSISYLDRLHEGGIADKYPKGAKHPKGKPDLNGLSILEKAFELDSNRSNAAVNQAKMRPPQTLCSFKVEGAERSLRSINLRFLTSFTNHSIAQSPITRFLVSQLNGFLILVGRGRVRVELLAHCRKLPLNSSKEAHSINHSLPYSFVFLCALSGKFLPYHCG